MRGQAWGRGRGRGVRCRDHGTDLNRLENITIATRGQRTVHIVADQWEAGGELAFQDLEHVGEH